MNIGDLIYTDHAKHYLMTEAVSFHSLTEAQEFINAFTEKMHGVWPDAKATTDTMVKVQELRERCVMAQLRACPEVSAKQITTEAEIMVQYILNGAEKE